jgi:NitT/TauT family transport system substrate-binding protein
MKPQRIFSALLIAAFLLTACASEAVPETEVPTPVTLQLQWVTQAQFAGYYIALDKGWYAEEGIDLTIIPGGPDQDPVNLVVSGTRDFGTGLLADLAVAVQEGKQVIGIAQIQQSNGLLLVSKASSGVQTPKDLRGKRVSVWLGSWETQFNALMSQQSISSEDFSLVSQGYGVTPFLNDEVDVASAMSYNEYYTILESGIRREDLNIINYANFGLDFPGDTLFTSRALLEQNPDLCVRMVRASLRGWQYAIEHPEEAVDSVLKHDQTGVQTRAHQMSMMTEISKLTLTAGGTLGYSDAAALQKTLDTLMQFNILKDSVQPADVITNEIWQKAQSR